MSWNAKAAKQASCLGAVLICAITELLNQFDPLRVLVCNIDSRVQHFFLDCRSWTHHRDNAIVLCDGFWILDFHFPVGGRCHGGGPWWCRGVPSWDSPMVSWVWWVPGWWIWEFYAMGMDLGFGAEQWQKLQKQWGWHWRHSVGIGPA